MDNITIEHTEALYHTIESSSYVTVSYEMHTCFTPDDILCLHEKHIVNKHLGWHFMFAEMKSANFPASRCNIINNILYRRIHSLYCEELLQYLRLSTESVTWNGIAF